MLAPKNRKYSKPSPQQVDRPKSEDYVNIFHYYQALAKYADSLEARINWLAEEYDQLAMSCGM